MRASVTPKRARCQAAGAASCGGRFLGAGGEADDGRDGFSGRQHEMIRDGNSDFVRADDAAEIFLAGDGPVAVAGAESPCRFLSAFSGIRINEFI